MNKTIIIINGNNFSDLETFYEEMNLVLTRNLDWKMGQSLDALNDILYGGFGVFEPGESVHIIWENFSKSQKDLGYSETKKNYQKKVNQGYPYNVQLFKDKLIALEEGSEPFLCDIVVEIIRDHKNIELTLND